MAIPRRSFIRNAVSLSAASAVAGLGLPALAQGRAKVRVGYLHTPAVDGQPQ
ncbi:MAG: ABC transporter substrate-binding protein, partial [Comamonadaceae bacterium]